MLPDLKHFKFDRRDLDIRHTQLRLIGCVLHMCQWQAICHHDIKHILHMHPPSLQHCLTQSSSSSLRGKSTPPNTQSHALAHIHYTHTNKHMYTPDILHHGVKRVPQTLPSILVFHECLPHLHCFGNGRASLRDRMHMHTCICKLYICV